MLIFYIIDDVDIVDAVADDDIFDAVEVECPDEDNVGAVFKVVGDAARIIADAVARVVATDVSVDAWDHRRWKEEASSKSALLLLAFPKVSLISFLIVRSMIIMSEKLFETFLFSFLSDLFGLWSLLMKQDDVDDGNLLEAGDLSGVIHVVIIVILVDDDRNRGSVKPCSRYRHT